MAALTLKSIRLSSLALGAALAVTPPALGADVSVQLDAGAGFSVKNSTGAIERLRVDEATGNLSRNGALFVHTTGVKNTFVGVGAGNTSMTGYGNSAFGYAALRPVMFRDQPEQTLPSGEAPPPEYGLIAEEVAEVFPDLVVYDEAGQPFTVKYHEMAPMLLNEMKKQQQVIAELSSRLALLEGKAGSASAAQGGIR